MLKWLETYEGQGLEELLALKETHHIESLADVIYQAVDQKVHHLDREYTEFEVTVPTIIEFDNEVKNGGLYQFLTNYSGRFAEYLVGALGRVGATKSEALAKAAFKALPSNWQSMKRNEVEDLLDPFDQQFFQIFRNEKDLRIALVEYVGQNREEFSLPG